MTTLAAALQRRFEFNEDPLFNDMPVIASDIIYEGAAVGDDGNGFARPIGATDVFIGFAEKTVDNSGGSAGDVNVRVRQKGTVQLTVAGVVDVDDMGELVYTTDDDTFTLTVGTNPIIGRIVRHVSGTTAMVHFEAFQVQSPV